MSSAADSVVVTNLKAARSVAWSRLVPAFDHAIALAREAEHVAHHTENVAQTSVQPAYPPIVLDLAAAADIRRPR